MKQNKKGILMTKIILETFKLNGLLVSAGDQLTKEFELTSARWKILGALSNKAEAMTASDIARVMGQSRQAVQRIANEMIIDGLLETQLNPNHQRAKLLVLTNKGREKFKQIMIKQIPWVNSLVKPFNQSDLESVVITLKELNTHLNANH